MIQTDIFIIHCVLYCLLVVIAMIPVGIVNPRMMLQSYPKEIQQAVPPKTSREKRYGIFFSIPILVVMIGYPAFIGWYYTTSYVSAFMLIWSMMLVFNLFDLLVVDWLMFCYITPGFIVIKGTEGHPAYKNYMFHLVGFIKGIVITAAISALLAFFLQ